MATVYVPSVNPAVNSLALRPPPAAAVVDRTFRSRSGPVTRKIASPAFAARRGQHDGAADRGGGG
ncbi:hypothetical protein V2I01_36885 [Micromonospora sp. BRA006-A]|nr:hypothetical protein [Micromonospora sp. BRA006-A]